MAVLITNRILGLGLTILGALLAVLVFYYAINEYITFMGVELQEGDLLSIVTSSASVLLSLLIKIAFLGMALAASVAVLKYGVTLLKEEREIKKSMKAGEEVSD